MGKGKPQGKKRGKVSLEQIKKAYKMARDGHTLRVVLSSIGISMAAYQVIKAKKKDHIDLTEIELIEQIEKGFNEFFALMEQTVILATGKDMKFALEVLSRRRPKDWGRKDYLKADVKQNITYSSEIKNKIKEVEEKFKDAE